MVRNGTALLIAIAAGVAVTLLLAFGFADPIELPLRDVALRILPKEPAIATAVVAIDEPSLQQFGPWPWPRPRIAAMLDRIAASGARGVVLDILLADSRPGDDVLAASMRRLPVITIAAIGDRGEWLVPVEPLRSASTVAHASFELDHDGIVRRLASTKQSADRSLTAVCIEAASLVRPINVRIGTAVVPEFRTPPRSIPLVSASDVLSRASVPFLRGRIVFVGPTAMALGDRPLTPVSRVPDPGVTVHAAATESLIRGEQIRSAAPFASGLLVAVLVASVLMIRSRLTRLVVSAALVLLAIGGSVGLIATTETAVPMASIIAPVVIAAGVIEIRLITGALRQGSAVAARIESGLGIPGPAADRDVGPRLEEIAVRLAEHRAREVESKRVLAHELKTPLASMRGLSQLLSGFDLNDAERRRVGSLLESEAGKLESMVQGLLDIERLALRDFEATSAVIDAGDVVERRVGFLQASTDRELRSNVDRPLFVRADAQLVERVVDNLVGNALKYTSSAIDVRARQIDGSAAIEVEDRGAGLSATDRQRIFDRFARGASAAGTEGLGLGLALVAEIARWHGGSASVEQAASGGSLFRFTLPLAAAIGKAGAL